MTKDASRALNGPNEPGLEPSGVSSGAPAGAISLAIELHQVEFRTGDFKRNLDRIIQLTESSRAELVLFPEASITGFDYEQLSSAAEFNVEALSTMRRIARETGRGVILPLLVRSDEHYYNRQYCVGPEGGLLAWYDKIHLIGVLNEDRYLTAGREPVVVDYPARNGVIRMGLATCYDLRFPELFRSMVLKGGAELLILPAQWPRAREEHLRALVRARALENQCHLVVCNGVNRFVSMDLCGRSAVINAKGEILREASNDRGESIALELDFKETRAWRRTFPVLKDAVL